MYVITCIFKSSETQDKSNIAAILIYLLLHTYMQIYALQCVLVIHVKFRMHLFAVPKDQKYGRGKRHNCYPPQFENCDVMSFSHKSVTLSLAPSVLELTTSKWVETTLVLVYLLN